MGGLIKMGTKKVVTSVCLDPEVFERGREEGHNFSQLLEDAIIGESDPDKEIFRLEKLIRELEIKIQSYKERIVILKEKKETRDKTTFELLLDEARHDYENFGIVPQRLLERYSKKLGVKVDELEERVIYAFVKEHRRTKKVIENIEGASD
jgi:post-segregation antitoxin (ccd killing protein)